MISSKLYYRSTLGAHNAQCQNFMQSHWIPCDPTTVVVDDSTEIVCQIEGAESLHLALEQNPNFHTMSLLVAGTPLCSACVTALSGYGITAQDNAWTCGKKLAAIHIELRPTRF
jgi:hypothetical protein